MEPRENTFEYYQDRKSKSEQLKQAVYNLRALDAKDALKDPAIKEELETKTFEQLLKERKQKVIDLLDAGGEPSWPQDDNVTAFHLLVKHGDKELVAHALKGPDDKHPRRTGADVAHHGGEANILTTAVENGQTHLLQPLLDEYSKRDFLEKEVLDNMEIAAYHAVRHDNPEALKIYFAQKNRVINVSEDAELVRAAVEGADENGSTKCLDMCIDNFKALIDNKTPMVKYHSEMSDNTLQGLLLKMERSELLKDMNYGKKFIAKVAETYPDQAIRVGDIRGTHTKDEQKDLLVAAFERDPLLAMKTEAIHMVTDENMRKKMLEKVAETNAVAALEQNTHWKLLSKEQELALLPKILEQDPLTAYRLAEGGRAKADKAFLEKALLNGVKSDAGFVFEEAMKSDLLTKEQRENTLRNVGEQNAGHAFYLSHEYGYLDDKFQREMASKIQYNGVGFSRDLFIDKRMDEKNYIGALQLMEDSRLSQEQKDDYKRLTKEIYGIDIVKEAKEQAEKKAAPDKKEGSSLTPLEKAAQLALDASHKPAEPQVERNGFTPTAGAPNKDIPSAGLV